MENQNIYPFRHSASPWSILEEGEIPQETLGLERAPQYVYIDIHGAEIAELREKVERLEKKNEEREKQQSIIIQFLDSDKLEIKKPLYVSLSYGIDDELWIVDCPELNIYGSGRNETDAIKDFKIVLEESYFSLKKDKDKLAPHLMDEWKNLQEFIKER